jgi:uncharacterized oxidoreductase
VSDVGVTAERIELVQRIVKDFPSLNVLINNAGIQRRVNLLATESWEQIAREIDINLGGPVHLSMLLVPHLLTQDAPAHHQRQFRSGTGAAGAGADLLR